MLVNGKDYFRRGAFRKVVEICRHGFRTGRKYLNMNLVRRVEFLDVINVNPEFVLYRIKEQRAYVSYLHHVFSSFNEWQATSLAVCKYIYYLELFQITNENKMNEVFSEIILA